jgi:hypothetical protein
MHEHVFVDHIGIPVFGGTATAWVPEGNVENKAAYTNVESARRMLRCIYCGEQGYEIPRDVAVPA